MKLGPSTKSVDELFDKHAHRHWYQHVWSGAGVRNALTALALALTAAMLGAFACWSIVQNF